MWEKRERAQFWLESYPRDLGIAVGCSGVSFKPLFYITTYRAVPSDLCLDNISHPWVGTCGYEADSDPQRVWDRVRQPNKNKEKKKKAKHNNIEYNRKYDGKTMGIAKEKIGKMNLGNTSKCHITDPRTHWMFVYFNTRFQMFLNGRGNLLYSLFNKFRPHTVDFILKKIVKHEKRLVTDDKENTAKRQKFFAHALSDLECRIFYGVHKNVNVLFDCSTGLPNVTWTPHDFLSNGKFNIFLEYLGQCDVLYGDNDGNKYVICVSVSKERI